MSVAIQDVIRFVTRLVTPDRLVLVGFVVTLSARGRGRPLVEIPAQLPHRLLNEGSAPFGVLNIKAPCPTVPTKVAE